MIGRPVVQGRTPAGKCAVVEAGSTGERGTYHRPRNGNNPWHEI
jgi:hypothetical protein